jgi:Protein of unknown function (DUF2891)
MNMRIRLATIITAAWVVMSSGAGLAQQTSTTGATPVRGEFKDLDAMLKSLPAAAPPVLDDTQAPWLAAMPLACLDRPQAHPPSRGYLWEATYRPVDGYEKNLAFYGCFDWHSSVNSIWTLVRLLKAYPTIAVAPLAKHKLGKHLDKTNVAGELAFLKAAGQFERPYGYAWILKLAAELADWNDPDAKKWSANLAPLAEWTSKEMTQFLTSLERPNRGGVHPNTAFAMYLMLDYVESAKDDALKTAITEAAKRFYTADKNCDTKSEPAGTDFLSPCLTEAALVSRVVDRQAFLTWIDAFLPPMNSPAFKPFTEPVDTTGITRPDKLAGKSHLIGLAFQRGVVMSRLADVLPRTDRRVDVLRRLAALHGVKGMQGMHDAGYYGSHWLATYAVYYMTPQSAEATR